MKVVVKNESETALLAKKFAKTLKLGDIVLLNGDLGAGKTTFTKYVFRSLGVKEVVSSPTFAILKSYTGKFVLHHFDAYRITVEEAIEAGFDEVLSDKNSIIFVEWAENIMPLIKGKIINVNIKYISENVREFSIDE